MFPAASPRQPNKKRRLDFSDNNKAGPSSEILPLVSPNLVPKSSKDPNRGMYPQKKVKSKAKFASFPCPTFSKASKLFRESPRFKHKAKSEDNEADISLSDISIQEDTLQKETFTKSSNCSTGTSSSHVTNEIFVRGKIKTKSHKSKFSHTNIANKIINYFKPVNSVSKSKGSDVFKNYSIETPLSRTQANCNSLEVPKNANEKFFKTYRDCYGLLGESTEVEDIDENSNFFQRLPIHVMETIFCQIPFLDLMKCRLVCTTWNEVISDCKFIEWKKLYYELKLQKPGAFRQLEELCDAHDLRNVDDCFKILTKYMGEEYCRKPAPDMYEYLTKSSKGFDAECIVAERFPELDGRDSRAWSIFAVAIILSETVWDVFDLYRYLLMSQCSLHDITDSMYCIATFLLFFQRVHNINHGLHYRVYYTLYLIENNVPSNQSEGTQSLKVVKGLPGQQSIHSYGSKAMPYLTYEQIRIINHCFQPKQVIRIMALAGTGKTTTLIHLARLYPQVKFLNIMYNKAVCEEAKRRFPPNVTCRTAHALAFRHYGRRLQHKLASKVRPHDLVTLLEHHSGCDIPVYSYARQVLTTIENFAASSSSKISIEHVPLFRRDRLEKPLSASERDKIKKDALVIWKKMVDKDNKQVKATHDVYLKLYQLSKPDFSEYQCIMVDEAQDCNPVMLEIVTSQNLPVILVGDPNQQIYGFRGAQNAMRSVKATHTYHLTKSFRFGPEIAYIASCCLEVLKFNTRETLVGSTQPSWINGKTQGQYAIIARTNVHLFNEVVRLCCHMDVRAHEPTYVAGAFAGGIESYGFDQLLDIYTLRSSTHKSTVEASVSDKFICKFKSFNELYNYAKNVEDSDLLSKIELVNKYGDNIPEYVKIIKEKCGHSIELANIIFTTAHKSKGLEFDTVSMTDDYQIGSPEDNHDDEATGEENSIVYVAVSRAKRCLLISEKMMNFLLFAQEKFEYPVSSKRLLSGKPELVCVHCTQTFIPHTAAVLVRRRIVMAKGRVISGGPLCMKCGTEPTFRPQVHVDAVIMYLDPRTDYAHRSMACLVGPLPSDPPIERSTFGVFNAMDVVYVINVNL